MRLSIVIAIVSVSGVAAPIAQAHILAIAGAVGFDDQPFINLVQSLATEERFIYQGQRPIGCTSFYTSPTTGSDVMKGNGYTILLRPTGDFAIDWPLARTRLETEIQNFQNYLQGVDLPCECREYLHIIGFSDGASTIGGWLNLGAINTQAQDDHYGVVGLIDVIRQFNDLNPNTNTNATWTVSAMPANRLVIEYISFRNRSGGILEQCNILTNNWTGHRILTSPTPWPSTQLNDVDLCHTEVPDDNFVEPFLVVGVQAATLELITNDLAAGMCNCVSVSVCPDLDGDGDVDLGDWEIMQGNATGPTSGSRLRGPIPGDIDLDGDVDLKDIGQFQRAFSGS